MSELPTTLRYMLQNDRLPHAVCLEGEAQPALELAKRLAGAAMCERQQGEMCGECLHCRKVLAGVHADVCLPDPLDGGYKKDAVRTLRAEIYRSPHEGRAKVMIFRDAQQISAEVQNLLLKVLEDPPDDVLFVLLCDNRYKLLPTVLSRMAIVTLPPKDDKLLLDELLKTTEGQRADAVLRAAVKGGYGLLVALQPCEKTRKDYSAMLDAAERLLGLCEYRKGLGITPIWCAKLREILRQAQECNESNGYLPLISAAMAERLAR